jgi:hypothetical protein
MAGFMRLLVCGGLFVAGYYLGRRSHLFESQQNLEDTPEDEGAAPESDSSAANESEGN